MTTDSYDGQEFLNSLVEIPVNCVNLISHHVGLVLIQTFGRGSYQTLIQTFCRGSYQTLIQTFCRGIYQTLIQTFWREIYQTLKIPHIICTNSNLNIDTQTPTPV